MFSEGYFDGLFAGLLTACGAVVVILVAFGVGYFY